MCKRGSIEQTQTLIRHTLPGFPALCIVCRTLERQTVFHIYKDRSQESIPPGYVASAGIFKQSIGARNQVGIRLSYRPLAINIGWRGLIPCAD